MTETNDILLVEDSDTQALKFELLFQQEGLSVIRKPTAEDALSYMSDHRPDILVVDYHLPGMNGDEFCRLIRMNTATESIPLLILTDQDETDTEREGLESGADDYVAKSADAEVLVARVQALLRKPRLVSPVTEATSGYFTARRILVVDDSPTYLMFLEAELRHESYQVETASSGEAALAAIEKAAVDCIVVDLVMPGIDGIELCRRLDAYRRSSHQVLPVLMVTGLDSKDDMMRALEAGADDFVSKSNDIAILKARIRALLRRKFLHDEHQKILNEFRTKELEVIRERADKEAVMARAELAEQLEEANRELRDTQTQLVHAAKMASLGELVAGVAHEVNNPLAFSMSHLGTVASALAEIDEEADNRLTERSRKRLAKARERTGDIDAGLERVRQLVAKLRTFSRLDEGEFKLADVREDIESTIALVSHRIIEGITIETRYARENALFCAPGSLNQAIMNLITNAMDAVGDEGTITITTRWEDGFFVISVADTGPGVPEEITERVFEPFFTTKDVGQGTGLGLAISYRIAEQHRGRIEVQNRPNGGAEFTIRIPTNLEELTHAA